MKQKMAKKLLCIAVAGMMFPMAVQAADADLQLKVDKLTEEVNDLKGTVQRNKDTSLSKWLSIGGSYRFRLDTLRGETVGYTSAPATFANAQNILQSNFFNSAIVQNPADGSTLIAAGTPEAASFWQAQLGGMMTFQSNMNAVKNISQANAFLSNPATQQMLGGLGNFGVMVPAYKPKNETLYTSKFALDLHAKATQDVTVNVKLGIYKTFGTQSDSSTMNAYFADRVGTFDGTLGHVPSSSLLNVDRAYATWSNIADQPVWFSVGRRPATDGAPSNLRQNTQRPGNGGTPALLVDYAFDGMTLGYAPDIEMLPGFYTKVCYGRAFESGLTKDTTNIKDTDMLGVAIIPIDTDPLRVWMQWNKGFNIFDFPEMNKTAFGDTAPSVNLGSIDWFGLGAMTTLKAVGPGTLNFFADAAMSITQPNTNVSSNAMFQGLLTGAPFQPETPSDKKGYAAFAGVRYDLPSRTKLGFEFNHGSKNWIPFTPSADDMWTSKVGTRGNVYEGYVIQELDLKPISSYFSTAFFKLGYQYYDFDYTGSNNWVGAPIKISDLAAYQANRGMLLMAPVKKAQDIYATFEVKF